MCPKRIQEQYRVAVEQNNEALLSRYSPDKVFLFHRFA